MSGHLDAMSKALITFANNQYKIDTDLQIKALP